MPALRSKLDPLIRNEDIKICSIMVGSREETLYRNLTEKPDKGYKVIGRGEASVIAMAVHQNGIVGSNNLRDIRPYIELYNLPIKTTADILLEAYQYNMISEKVGNGIWQDMIKRQRYLPTTTFSDYLNTLNKK